MIVPKIGCSITRREAVLISIIFFAASYVTSAMVAQLG